LNQALTPFVIVFYTLPKLALAPLFIVWFGIGLPMKVALTATVVYFPVFITALAGAQNVTEGLVDIVKIMGGSRTYVLSRIVMPSVLTWLFVGLKQSIPYALLGAVVGELIVSDKGAGYLLSTAAGQFDTAGVFAVLFVLVILGYGSYEIIRLVEKHAFPWKKSSSASVSMDG
jgi:NitT/TauT family transport system permease protein